jgi:hypothetical protein
LRDELSSTSRIAWVIGHGGDIMIILVINSGSSSIKYKLFEVAHRRVMASGLAEKIGESNSILTHVYTTAAGEEKKHLEESRITDHHQGLQRIVDLLMDPQTAVIGNRSEITAIGHRVVHGGDSFEATTLIDDRVIADIEACIPLAPLHNPANLMGIQVARKIFPRRRPGGCFRHRLSPRAFQSRRISMPFLSNSTRNTRSGATGFTGPPMPSWRKRPPPSSNDPLPNST